MVDYPDYPAPKFMKTSSNHQNFALYKETEIKESNGIVRILPEAQQ